MVAFHKESCVSEIITGENRFRNKISQEGGEYTSSGVQEYRSTHGHGREHFGVKAAK